MIEHTTISIHQLKHSQGPALDISCYMVGRQIINYLDISIKCSKGHDIVMNGIRGQYLGLCLVSPVSSYLLKLYIRSLLHSHCFLLLLSVSCSVMPSILYLGQYVIIGQCLVSVCLTIYYSIYISKCM